MYVCITHEGAIETWKQREMPSVAWWRIGNCVELMCWSETNCIRNTCCRSLCGQAHSHVMNMVEWPRQAWKNFHASQDLHRYVQSFDPHRIKKLKIHQNVEFAWNFFLGRGHPFPHPPSRCLRRLAASPEVKSCLCDCVQTSLNVANYLRFTDSDVAYHAESLSKAVHCLWLTQ